MKTEFLKKYINTKQSEFEYNEIKEMENNASNGKIYFQKKGHFLERDFKLNI